MDAEMIILCDGVVIPQSKKEIDGGVAIAGGHILRIGARAELSDYLGVVKIKFISSISVWTEFKEFFVCIKFLGSQNKFK